MASALRRAITLARQGRPVAAWRRTAFISGAALVTVVQLPPFDTIADQVLSVHVLQHILIGDVASFLIVIGVTGPLVAPLLQIRGLRPIRRLAHPLVALIL